ncbi:MAG: DUF1801 domain-containing protein [Chloroflexi bacterium]|nr:MAG: DUF1801 domain-containing protein [Chloroflexota bacterium]
MPTAEQLKRVPPAVRPIVEAAIHIVKATAPGAEEIPYRMAQPRSKSMMWKLVRYAVDGEPVVGVGTFTGHSAMFFYRGRELDDSSGLPSQARRQATSGLAVSLCACVPRPARNFHPWSLVRTPREPEGRTARTRRSDGRCRLRHDWQRRGPHVADGFRRSDRIAVGRCQPVAIAHGHGLARPDLGEHVRDLHP